MDQGARKNTPLSRRRRRLALLEQAASRVPISWSLVGVQKGATSSLYRMLVEHPRMVGGPEKEMRFFIDEQRDWDDPDYSDYVRPARSELEDTAGDATPAYFFWPDALTRMRRYRAEMRLIVTVRDPVERAMSQWSMERARFPQFPDVPTTIAELASPVLPDRIPDGMGSSRFGRLSLYTRGLYGQQLRRGHDAFPPEQWLVLDFRELSEDPERTLDRATDHIGLPRFTDHPKAIRRNVTRTDHTGRAPTGDDIARLVGTYADDLADFQQLTGLDLSGWPTWQVVRGDLAPSDFAERISRKLGLTSSGNG